MGKRRKLFVVAGIVLAVLAIAGGVAYYYKWYRTDRVDNANTKTLAESLAKGIEEDKTEIFNTPGLRQVSEAFYANDHNKVVDIAPDICSETYSMSRYSCYGLYGQSLVKVKDYEKLGQISNSLLAEQQVKNNLTLTNTWNTFKEAATKKVDPSTLPTLSNQEALE